MCDFETTNIGVFLAELRNQAKEDFECYYLPCYNWDELINMQDAYYQIIKEGYLKKIIYSIGVVLWLDDYYKIDLFIKNSVGLDNAECLYKIFKENGFITEEELNAYKTGILVGKDLEGGDLNISLPKRNDIIDFIYCINPDELEKVRNILFDYNVILWPDILKDEFEQIEIECI